MRAHDSTAKEGSGHDRDHGWNWGKWSFSFVWLFSCVSLTWPLTSLPGSQHHHDLHGHPAQRGPGHPLRAHFIIRRRPRPEVTKTWRGETKSPQHGVNVVLLQVCVRTGLMVLVLLSEGQSRRWSSPRLLCWFLLRFCRAAPLLQVKSELPHTKMLREGRDRAVPPCSQRRWGVTKINM